MKQPPLGATFWRMYAATASSDLADGIGRTALPLAAASYTRDPVTISGMVTFAFLPWLLLALPSGALVDRVDRRIAMAAANVVRAVTVAALAVVLLAHVGNVAVLYGVAFVLGAAETVYDCAVRALLPQIVTRDQLDRANSLVTVEESLGQTFIGAPLGSVLFAAAIALPFVLNLSVRGSYRPARIGGTTIRADMAEGIRWLRAHQLLRGLTLISAGCAFAQTMGTGVLVLYVLEVLHLPAGDFGLLLVVAGVGSILGSLATPPLARRHGRRAVLTTGAVLSAVSIGLMSLTANGYVAAALFGISSAGVMAWNVLTMSMRQSLIPAELFGRVQGAYRTLVWGVIPVGSLAGGVLADAIGLRWVFAVAGGLLFVLALALHELLGRHADQLSGQLSLGRSGSADDEPVRATAEA
jgi:MFS family permease